MMSQASSMCSLRLLAALVIVSASAMTFADAGEEFRLLTVSKYTNHLNEDEIDIRIAFQGPEPYFYAGLEPKTDIYLWTPNVVWIGLPPKNITIMLKQPDAIYTLTLNEQTAENKYVNKTIPAVEFTLPDVVTYSAGDEVTFDVEVTSGVGPRCGVVSKELSFKTYVRKSDEVINYGDEGLLTVSDKTEQDGRAVFQVDLDTEGSPRGLAIIKASVVFDPAASPVVRSIQIEKMVELHSTDERSALKDGAVFRGVGSLNRYQQICDMSSPACVVSCALFSRPRIVDFNMNKGSWFGSGKDLPTEKRRDFGVITTYSYVMANATESARGEYWCQGKIGWRGRTLRQLAEVDVKQSAHLVLNISGAQLHPNQTLDVRCAAYGTPSPKIAITAADDPSESLWDRFPAESYPRFYTFDSQHYIRYTLNKPSFTSSLTNVTCTASSRYGPPTEIVLPVVPVE